MAFLVYHDNEAQQLMLRLAVVEGRCVVKLPRIQGNHANASLDNFLKKIPLV